MITNYSRYLLIINGAILTGCAVLDFALRDKLLIALLLFLPFIDKEWSIPKPSYYDRQWKFRILIFTLIAILIFLYPVHLETIILILLFTALPEEWFFRSYFMQRLEVLYHREWFANYAASLLFAFLHVTVQGWIGLAVFVPSLFFGWLYQRNRDLVLVVMLHGLFNAIYLIFLRDVLI